MQITTSRFQTKIKTWQHVYEYLSIGYLVLITVKLVVFAPNRAGVKRESMARRIPADGCQQPMV